MARAGVFGVVGIASAQPIAQAVVFKVARERQPEHCPTLFATIHVTQGHALAPHLSTLCHGGISQLCPLTCLQPRVVGHAQTDGQRVVHACLPVHLHGLLRPRSRCEEQREQRQDKHFHVHRTTSFVMNPCGVTPSADTAIDSVKPLFQNVTRACPSLSVTRLGFQYSVRR